MLVNICLVVLLDARLNVPPFARGSNFYLFLITSGARVPNCADIGYQRIQNNCISNKIIHSAVFILKKTDSVLSNFVFNLQLRQIYFLLRETILYGN